MEAAPICLKQIESRLYTSGGAAAPRVCLRKNLRQRLAFVPDRKRPAARGHRGLLERQAGGPADRGVQVADADVFLGHLGAFGVARAVDVAALDAGSGEHGREDLGIMAT